jgi:serine/threonine-protein kinase
MVGSTIAHYKVIAELGRGGMGVVYKAEDTRLHRPVALKLLLDTMAKPEDQERFMIEARAAAALNHPNIATVYQVEDTGAHTFIAMEFIEGRDLREMVEEEGGLDAELVIDIAIQAADGLAAAHEKGIIHRDIKSANMMLQPDGRVKIMDFGLARIGGGTMMTQVGMSMGTVAYMSPEQARGVDVDHRSDIWAFGVVLYELVTGRLPFAGAFEQSMMYAIFNEEPGEAQELEEGLAGKLSPVIKKALVKDQQARYQSMNEVREDLRRIKEGQLVATLTSMPGFVSAASPAGTTSIAVLPFSDMSREKDQEYFCDGITEELIDVLSKVDEWKVISRSSSFSFKGKEAGVKEIGGQLGASHIVEGSVRKAGNRVRITGQLSTSNDGFQVWSEKYDRELDDIFAIQDEIAAALAGKLKVSLAETQEAEEAPQLARQVTENMEAYDLYLKARFNMNMRTEEGLRTAVQLCEQAIELDPGFAVAHSGLADALILLSFQGALPPTEFMPHAKDAAEKAVQLDDSLAEAHTSLACIRAVYDWDWSSARASFKKALGLNPKYPTAHHWYTVWFLLPTAEFDEARSEFEQALELDPLSLVLMAGIGWQYYFAGQYESAIKALQKVLDQNADFVMARDLMGQSLLQLGRSEEALGHLEAAVELSNRRSLSVATLGHAYAVTGRRSEAESIVEELLERSSRQYLSAFDLALVYAGLEEHYLAFEQFDRAVHDRNGWLCFIGVDPRLRPLHGEMRFEMLLSQLGLSAYEGP